MKVGFKTLLTPSLPLFPFSAVAQERSEHLLPEKSGQSSVVSPLKSLPWNVCHSACRNHNCWFGPDCVPVGLSDTYAVMWHCLDCWYLAGMLQSVCGGGKPSLKCLLKLNYMGVKCVSFLSSCVSWFTKSSFTWDWRYVYVCKALLCTGLCVRVGSYVYLLLWRQSSGEAVSGCRVQSAAYPCRLTCVHGFVQFGLLALLEKWNVYANYIDPEHFKFNI